MGCVPDMPNNNEFKTYTALLFRNQKKTFSRITLLIFRNKNRKGGFKSEYYVIQRNFASTRSFIMKIVTKSLKTKPV